MFIIYKKHCKQKYSSCTSLTTDQSIDKDMNIMVDRQVQYARKPGFKKNWWSFRNDEKLDEDAIEGYYACCLTEFYLKRPPQGTRVFWDLMVKTFLALH